MKTLAERHADRVARKLLNMRESQFERQVITDLDGKELTEGVDYLSRSGVGVVNMRVSTEADPLKLNTVIDKDGGVVAVDPIKEDQLNAGNDAANAAVEAAKNPWGDGPQPKTSTDAGGTAPAAAVRGSGFQAPPATPVTPVPPAAAGAAA